MSRTPGTGRSPPVWHVTRDGLPARPGAEGFVHASFTDQLPGTLATHFPDEERLVLLRLDPAALSGRLRLEASRGGALFPHVYGEIGPGDVIGRVELRRDGSGRFDLSGLSA